MSPSDLNVIAQKHRNTTAKRVRDWTKLKLSAEQQTVSRLKSKTANSKLSSYDFFYFRQASALSVLFIFLYYKSKMYNRSQDTPVMTIMWNYFWFILNIFMVNWCKTHIQFYTLQCFYWITSQVIQKQLSAQHHHIAELKQQTTQHNTWTEAPWTHPQHTTNTQHRGNDEWKLVAVPWSCRPWGGYILHQFTMKIFALMSDHFFFTSACVLIFWSCREGNCRCRAHLNIICIFKWGRGQGGVGYSDMCAQFHVDWDVQRKCAWIHTSWYFCA